jgi:hypothetical protein
MKEQTKLEQILARQRQKLDEVNNSFLPPKEKQNLIFHLDE